MRLPLITIFVAISALLGACAEDIDQQFDCWAICDKYETCVSDDYDKDACADRCETAADNDAEFADKADSCEACIDDRSCAEAVFPCAAECAGIVP